MLRDVLGHLQPGILRSDAMLVCGRHQLAGFMFGYCPMAVMELFNGLGVPPYCIGVSQKERSFLGT